MCFFYVLKCKITDSHFSKAIQIQLYWGEIADLHHIFIWLHLESKINRWPTCSNTALQITTGDMYVLDKICVITYKQVKNGNA